MADQAFGVETVELDLPAVAGAFAQRLHEAGMPVTPARSADVARALAIVRPQSRRRLYWTMRSVLVTDPAEVRIFDRAFREVFGDGRPDQAFEPDEQHVTAAEEEQRAPVSSTSAADGAAQEQGMWRASAPSDGDDDRPPVDIPLALASGEERLAERSFDSLDPHELAQLYDLMSRLRLATPAAAHATGRAGAPRAADRSPADAAHEPAHGRGARCGWPAGGGAPCRGGW